MIKRTKKFKYIVGDVLAVPLVDGTYALAQICYLFETEGYISPTIAFFDIRGKNLEDLKKAVSDDSFKKPVFIFTITGDELKNNKWIVLKNQVPNYTNVNVKDKITGTWGWYNNAERDMNWILEMYFGIYPWDAFYDPNYMDKLLVEGATKPSFAKMKKDFPKEMLDKLGIKN